MNALLAQDSLSKLLQWGVQEFYICAGARNLPLVQALCELKTQQPCVFHHFEERSAAFYALGRIKDSGKPVAVITTSGTAVGELLPACMEAFYSGLPLVLLTADRPRRYRGTGAPQSAEQKNIFGPYVSQSFDLEGTERLCLTNTPTNKPVHVNLCFEAPLASAPCTNRQRTPWPQEQTQEHDLLQASQKLRNFILSKKNILVVVTQLSQKYKEHILPFLSQLGAPVYLEALSHLREEPLLNPFKLKCPDTLWQNASRAGFPIDGVLKIGNTPTHRLWRDLDEGPKDIPVLSVNELPFSGAPGAQHLWVDLCLFFDFIKNNNILEELPQPAASCQDLLLLDHQDHLRLLQLCTRYPCAEQSLIHALSKQILPKASVYLGNSMPIRTWDLLATHQHKDLHMQASRGLNGIDGQLSSFLGFANPKHPQNWGLFGDLTALYDMASLWMLPQRPALNVQLVIVNNKGGRIFDKVLSGPAATLCRNPHDLSFEHLAAFWGLAYNKLCDSQAFLDKKSLPQQQILELCPDKQQTDAFDKEGI